MQKTNFCNGLLDNWYSNLIIDMERLNTIYPRIYIRKYVYCTFPTLANILYKYIEIPSITYKIRKTC